MNVGRCSLTTSRTVLHLNAGKDMHEQTSVCVLKIKTLNIKKKKKECHKSDREGRSMSSVKCK